MSEPTVGELPGRWLEQANGPVPTDRAIGCVTCAAELKAALAPVVAGLEQVEGKMRRIHEVAVVHCDEQMDAGHAEEWADELAALRAALMGGRTGL